MASLTMSPLVVRSAQLPAARFLGAVPLVSSRKVSRPCTVVKASAEKASVFAAVAGAASLLVAESAQAAQEVAQLADADARPLLLFLAPAVAIGWVLFNILGPAQNQLSAMNDKNAKRSVAIGAGLTAASLFAAESANAAQEVAQLADGDARPVLLFLAPAVALAWVGFNILGPAQNQLTAMTDKNAKRSVAIGAGLTAASLFAAESANAAQEVAQLADADARPFLLFLAPAVAIGWVLFNILGPAKNQLDAMQDKNSKK